MKKLILLFSLLISQFAFAQKVTFKIKCLLKDTTTAKYAYLTTLSQNRTVSSDKIFLKTPIVHGEFQFIGDFNLSKADYQYASVFIDTRDNITKEEAVSKFSNLIWVTGRELNFRTIILEDISLQAESKSKMIDAKVISGGKFTKQVDESNLAVRAGNKKLVAFIKKYPNSPISFKQVATVTDMYDEMHKDKFNAIFGTPNELFEKLSEQVKRSKKGMALKKIINEKTKH